MIQIHEAMRDADPVPAGEVMLRDARDATVVIPRTPATPRGTNRSAGLAKLISAPAVDIHSLPAQRQEFKKQVWT